MTAHAFGSINDTFNNQCKANRYKGNQLRNERLVYVQRHVSHVTELKWGLSVIYSTNNFTWQ